MAFATCASNGNWLAFLVACVLIWSHIVSCTCQESSELTPALATSPAAPFSACPCSCTPPADEESKKEESPKQYVYVKASQPKKEEEKKVVLVKKPEPKKEEKKVVLVQEVPEKKKEEHKKVVLVKPEPEKPSECCLTGLLDLTEADAACLSSLQRCAPT